MKKTLLIGLAVCIFFAPTPAHALLNFSGCAAAGAGGAVSGTVGAIHAVPVNDTIVRANTTAITTKECVLDGLASVLTQALITATTQSIINWINSGFEGGPAFITNYSFFLQNIANDVAVDFIQGSELGALCSPFEDSVRLGLIRDYQRQNSFAQRISCSVDEENLGPFLQGDFFGGGGWETLFRVATEPQNNPLYARLQAQDEQIVRTIGAQQERLLETSEGGFLSKRKCVRYGRVDIEDPDGTVIQGERNCVQYEIVTPGTQIESQLDTILGSGIRQLELADEIDEVINALLAGLSQQIFTSLDGLRGLSSNTGSSAFNGQSYIGRLSEEVDTATFTQARTVLIDDITTAVQFEESYQTVLSEIIAVHESVESNLGEIPEGCSLSSAGVLTDYKNLRTASIERVSTLLTLRSRAQSASAANELNAVADEYELLLVSGTLQTSGDIAFLNQELNALNTCTI